MNTIKADFSRSKYGTAPHLCLFVDSLPFDQFLATQYNRQELLGLVPTLLDWLEDPAERTITWQRIAPQSGSTTIAPILMCPDDCDFWCTIVVVEVEATPEVIFWHRVGLAAGGSEPTSMPASIFEKVIWFAPPIELSFVSAEYHECLDAFRRALS